MPSSNNAHFAAEQFTPLLERFSFQCKKTLRAPDPEAVHDLRVAVRRFTQVLVAFESRFTPLTLKAIRTQLKNLLSAAGAVRDCDIAIEMLGKTGSPNLSKVGEELHVRRKGAEHRLLNTLRRMARQQYGAKWAAALKEAPAAQSNGQNWDESARQEVPRRAKTFFHDGNRAADGKASAGDLHKVRIAAKKFRYTFEIYESAFGPTAESRLEQLREVQSLLGDINDIRTVRKLLDELGGDKKVDAALRKHLRKKKAEFCSFWETKYPSGERKEWMRFLRQPARKPVTRSGSAQSPAAERVMTAGGG